MVLLDEDGEERTYEALMECAYQAGKVFEQGGPFADLLDATSRCDRRPPSFRFPRPRRGPSRPRRPPSTWHPTRCTSLLVDCRHDKDCMQLGVAVMPSSGDGTQPSGQLATLRRHGTGH